MIVISRNYENSLCWLDRERINPKFEAEVGTLIGNVQCEGEKLEVALPSAL